MTTGNSSEDVLIKPQRTSQYSFTKTMLVVAVKLVKNSKNEKIRK